MKRRRGNYLKILTNRLAFGNQPTSNSRPSLWFSLHRWKLRKTHRELILAPFVTVESIFCRVFLPLSGISFSVTSIPHPLLLIIIFLIPLGFPWLFWNKNRVKLSFASIITDVCHDVSFTPPLLLHFIPRFFPNFFTNLPFFYWL